jgi:hypothetical protein
VSGLLAYFPFDDDTVDHTGNGHDITASAVSVTSGKFGNAYHFDGVSSTMQLGGQGMLEGARTLCAWIKPVSVTGAGQPIFAGGSANVGDFFSIQSSTPASSGDCGRAPAEGEPFLDHWGYACILGDSLHVPNGAWSLLCYANDGAGTERFFVNGTVVETMGMNYGFGLSTVTIGSTTLDGSTSQAHFHGAIDEVTIWDHALTAAELATLWSDSVSCVP